MDQVLEIWKLIKDGGPAIIFLLMGALYWLNSERKSVIAERDRLQAQKDLLNDRVLNVANDAAGAIEDFRNLLIRGVEKSK